MQNPFNFNSLRRAPREYSSQNYDPRTTQNYGHFPDPSLLQNYGVMPMSQYDFFTRQFQNELELKHHFNSLLNVCQGDGTCQMNDLSRSKQLNTEYWGSADFDAEGMAMTDSSDRWYSNGTREGQWSSTTHNTPQQHINGGSWVTFNNV